MDRRLWKMTLTENWSPPWPCPECGQGKLKLKDRRIPHYEARSTVHCKAR